MLRTFTREYNVIPQQCLAAGIANGLCESHAEGLTAWLTDCRCAGFLDLCFDAKRAVEITLQPIRRFGFDAAILFSDILVVPHALGQRVSFVEGEGPRLDPLNDPAALQKLRSAIDHAVLEPVYETITRVRQGLPPAVAFLGFCGAPWTLATYMIAGQGTPDQAPARLFAYRHPDAFAKLIDVLVDASASYLVRQFAAGVDAVQIFDTWVGILPLVVTSNLSYGGVKNSGLGKEASLEAMLEHFTHKKTIMVNMQ